MSNPSSRSSAFFSSKTKIAAFAAMLLVLGAFWLGYQSFFKQEPVSLISVVAGRGSIEQTVLATGTIKPVRLVAVGAQVSGRLVSLKVALGERVEAGALIAEIDSVPQQNQLRIAKANLDYARAQKREKEASLALAIITYNRQKSMLARSAVSQADFDAAAAEVKGLEAQIAQLDAQIVEKEVSLETARVDLGYTRITAPIAGTVLAVVTQEGQTVNAVQSAPTIVVLGDLSTMAIRAEISEADVTRVRVGQKLFFTVLGEPDHRFDAVLESVEPAPESITSDSSISGSSSSSASSTASSAAIYYNGLFNVPNEDGRLKTYMTAEVHIIIGSAIDVVTIPSAALGPKQEDGSYIVYVVGESNAVSPRKVEVGLNNRITAEIRSGLAEGERVAMGQGAMIAAGTTLRRPSSPMGF